MKDVIAVLRLQAQVADLYEAQPYALHYAVARLVRADAFAEAAVGVVFGLRNLWPQIRRPAAKLYGKVRTVDGSLFV